jgi:hypothetical protein
MPQKIMNAAGFTIPVLSGKILSEITLIFGF